MSTKVSGGSANEHGIRHVFKYCHDSLKGARRGTRRHLLKTEGGYWEESPTGHSTVHVLRKDLTNGTSDLVPDFNSRRSTNHMTIFKFLEKEKEAHSGEIAPCFAFDCGTTEE